jgi:hypothetical protein
MLAHDTKNDHRYDDLLNDTDELGKQAGLGKDVQIKFLLKITDAAYCGVIDLTANKFGQDVDDAAKLTERYVKAQGSATVFDHKAGNQRKAMSITRTCIKLGSWSKGGNGEPIATVNSLMTIRATLRKDPANAKKLDDAANTLIKYARAQLKSDTLIEPEELRGMCFKKEHETRTVEDVLEATRKSLKSLYEGKHAAGVRNTPMVKQAIDKITADLKAIADERRNAGAQQAVADLEESHKLAGPATATA